MPSPPSQEQPTNRQYKRKPTFDPTDRELFDLQRQGVDWQLPQNGFVHRYLDQFSLDTACKHLADLDYLVRSFDAGTWHEVADMHTSFGAALPFPAYYGRNLDAFNDVAAYGYGSDANSAGTVIAIAGFDSLLSLDRRTALKMLDIFARQARLAVLYGHAILCLVESKDNDLGLVGGMSVTGATVAEFPPDPPEPFDESVVIEFIFQIYATDAEAGQYAVDLRSALAPLLDEIGRYQIRTELASERDGQSDKRHRSSGRERLPGQQLYDISIGARGRGDRSTFGENIFHAVAAAALRFEKMEELLFERPNLTAALENYPELDSSRDPAR